MADYRQALFGGPLSELPEDLPEYLRAQFSQNQVGDGGGFEFLTPGATVTDSQGRRVHLLNDDGSLMDGRNLAWNEGAEGSRRLDDDLGWVTDFANLNESPWESRHKGNQVTAAMMFAALAGGGLAVEAGMFGSGAGGGGMATDIAPGYLAESVAPQVTEVMAASPWEVGVGPMLSESVAPQVTEQMAQSPFWSPSVSVDPMLEESVAPQVTETMSGSPFPESWLDKLPDLARDLLGGGQQGGTNPVIAALMGGAGKLGEHRQDNDPYGLMASGYGPWKGLTDDPKAKVVDAMMKRKQDSIWS